MRPIILVYIIAVIYALIRYVAFAPKNMDNIPVFIMNKGVSMAAAVCLAVGFFQQLRKTRGVAVGVEPSLWFRAGVFGAIAHIPMSLAILRPGYFQEFFHEERLSLMGEMVFLFGGLTAGGIFLLTRPTLSAQARWWLSLTTMSTLFVHILSMGFCRGLNINRSHAYLPPMWLLSLIGVALGVWWLWRSRAASPAAREAPPWPPRSQ